MTFDLGFKDEEIKEIQALQAMAFAKLQGIEVHECALRERGIIQPGARKKMLTEYEIDFRGSLQSDRKKTEYLALEFGLYLVDIRSNKSFYVRVSWSQLPFRKINIGGIVGYSLIGERLIVEQAKKKLMEQSWLE